MEAEEPEFSLYQSNILYLLFISGAVICLALDIMVQINRRGELGTWANCFKQNYLISNPVILRVIY